MPPLGLTNTTALWGLLLIVPVIILYLLKPKPKHIVIPSVMFIMAIEKTKRFSSFLQKFVHDPLLLLQILIITVLVLALAGPFIMTEQVQTEDETIVVVLDASASMKASDVEPSRFEEGKKIAGSIVSKLSEKSFAGIVLAENIPIAALSAGNRESAIVALDKVECADTATNLGDSILLARDMLSGSTLKKIIYVISDFSNSESLSPAVAKKLASLEGIEVSFIRVGNSDNNLGITNIKAERSADDKRKLFLGFNVKNSGGWGGMINVRVKSDDVQIAGSEEQINAFSNTFFHFSPSISDDEQLITVELEKSDDLEVDNKAFALIPELKTHRIMLLTSENRDIYLRLAVFSLDNAVLKPVFPPVIPDTEGYDFVIVGSVNPEVILPGTFRNLEGYVEDGGTLIVVGTENLEGLYTDELKKLMPVEIREIVGAEKTVRITQNHEVTKDITLKNVVVKRYYKTVLENDSVSLLETENNSLLAYRSYGNGGVIYFGVNPDEKWSNLQHSYSFPILLSNLLNFMNRERHTVGIMDHRTGEYVSLPGVVEITTPSGKRATTNKLFLDEAGVYTLGYEDGKVDLPVNLLNEQESNISSGSSDAVMGSEFDVEKKPAKVKKDYLRELIVVVILMLLLEAVLYKRRGLI